ncbi:MAG: hypothetical protein R2711_07370 [Acidimicrobiales bacterium]
MQRGVEAARLPAHVAALAHRIGRPSLVICLDSFCGDYRRLWATTSLQGMVRHPPRRGAGRGRALRAPQAGSCPTRSASPAASRPHRGPRHRAHPHHPRCTPRSRPGAAPSSRRRRPTTASASPRFPYLAGHDAAGAAVADPLDRLVAAPGSPLTVVGADGLPATRDAGNVLPSHLPSPCVRLPPTVGAPHRFAPSRRP